MYHTYRLAILLLSTVEQSREPTAPTPSVGMNPIIASNTVLTVCVCVDVWVAYRVKRGRRGGREEREGGREGGKAGGGRGEGGRRVGEGRRGRGGKKGQRVEGKGTNCSMRVATALDGMKRHSDISFDGEKTCHLATDKGRKQANGGAKKLMNGKNKVLPLVLWLFIRPGEWPQLMPYILTVIMMILGGLMGYSEGKMTRPW